MYDSQTRKFSQLLLYYRVHRSDHVRDLQSYNSSSWLLASVATSCFYWSLGCGSMSLLIFTTRNISSSGPLVRYAVSLRKDAAKAIRSRTLAGILTASRRGYTNAQAGTLRAVNAPLHARQETTSERTRSRRFARVSSRSKRTHGPHRRRRRRRRAEFAGKGHRKRSHRLTKKLSYNGRKSGRIV